MAPKRFGKYEVLARIATGGAANIFLARQPGAADFHKLVCLKTLLPERASDADFVAMFLDEARLAARLNHPNCVQIFDLGRVRGSYYISMEYIFGETLWNLLATVTKLRTPLPASHVASIISSVCDGLHHAHELKDSNGRAYNLVHRDVSPQNVMITFEGQTKVVDFGIAKAETGRVPTMAGIVKGKFSYMSPEQITGGTIDRRSDVYSLGIVLFECLASRRLYRGETPEEIARLILEHRAPRLRDVVPDIPPALDNIAAIALARHPSKRFQTAHAMGEALRDYLDSIRYAQSAAAIARLVEQRFEGMIGDKRKVFESALAGTHEDAHLLKVLDARVVRDIDLFPDDEYPESAADPDFDERIVPAAVNAPSTSSAVGGPGPVSILTDRRLDGVADGDDEREEDAANQATQFEPDDGDDGDDGGDDDDEEERAYAAGESTRVDADAERNFEEDMAAGHVPTDGSTTTVEQSSVSRAPKGIDFGDRTELQQEVPERIERIEHFEADTGPVDRTPPPSPRRMRVTRSRQGSVSTGRGKSATNGGAALAPTLHSRKSVVDDDGPLEPMTLTTDITDDGLESVTRPPPKIADREIIERVPYVAGPILVRPGTQDMIPPPLDPNEALISTRVNHGAQDSASLQDSVVTDSPWADPTDGPSSKLPAVEVKQPKITHDEKTPPQSFPAPQPPLPPQTRTELDASAQRFGMVAVLAALALGIAIGLVLGLVLARLFYAPVTIPVTTRPESAAHSDTN